MGSAQLFSLRWNNYSHHITNALDDLRAEDELTDVTLCAEGNKIRAHKLLLSACSTFFRETFRENPCQHPVIILKGVSFTDLQAVVTFMYNGQVNVTQERLSCFLQTAEMLQIKGLTDMNDNKHDNHELDVPLRGVGGHVNSNHTSSKKRMNNVDSRLHAFPETLQQQQQQQRPPTPKRRKFIPSAPSAGQGDTNAAGNAYNNSPGPSGPSAAVNNNSGGGGEGTDVVTAATAAGQTALQSAITNTDSNSADDDYDGGVDGSAVGLAGMLKYEHDLQDDGDGGDGLLGDDEDEYRNNLSEDGDNSMLDYTNMEQGAIDSDIGGGTMGPSVLGYEGSSPTAAEEEGEEVMILQGAAGYDVVAYNNESDDVMPILSPSISLTSSSSSSNQPHHLKVGGSHHHGHHENKVTIRPILNKATHSSSPSSSSASSQQQPIPILTSTSHINILRRKRPLFDDPAELVNPLAALDNNAASSSRASSKAISPFVGEAMMDQETGEIMFPCLVCDKKYKLRSSLESHVKVHEGTENTCPICFQTMSRQRDLKRHVATVHRGLLMADGSITYPPDIDQLVPMRARKGRTRRSDGMVAWAEQDPNNSSDYYTMGDVVIKPETS